MGVRATAGSFVTAHGRTCRTNHSHFQAAQQLLPSLKATAYFFLSKAGRRIFSIKWLCEIHTLRANQNKAVQGLRGNDEPTLSIRGCNATDAVFSHINLFIHQRNKQNITQSTINISLVFKACDPIMERSERRILSQCISHISLYIVQLTRLCYGWKKETQSSVA